MKFKEGDIVYIRKYLSCDQFGIVDGMLKYRGMKGVITKCGVYYYLLNCDYGWYYWDDYMVEGIKEVRYKKLKRLEKL